MRRSGRALPAGLVLALAAGCGTSGGGGDAPPPATRGEKPVVGVILPDRTSSTRWEEQDRPLLSQAFQLAGVEPFIENADGDETRFRSIADEMIHRGVEVLMITPLTSESGAAVEAQAAAAGIPVIDYDRISLGGSAEYYVSVDNEDVGELQAEGLVSCLGDRPGARVIEIQGSPSDYNATQFQNGQRRLLGPKYDSGALTLLTSTQIDRWDPVLGKQVFERNLADAGGRVDAVVAANDGLAEVVVEVLRERGLAGKIPVTGQDATLDGLKSVLRGEQCMTVHKHIRNEAEAAARLATALAKGDVSGADDLATGNTRDLVARRDVKSVLLGATLITRANLRSLVVDGVVGSEELCGGDLAELCRQNDIVSG
ncbi:sugar ABC transporter substrate-binding protein [Umezawaea beigongshangensis]|uniref:sugar ABC transporter substrate-binding protein n=1 Tax=Umezawaea beigongshangensis TaxID=2780383 RepID=UPI0018F19CB7|nr:substrate-binding domain-containing protein [Umezawaea beigongshangensis]